MNDIPLKDGKPDYEAILLEMADEYGAIKHPAYYRRLLKTLRNAALDEAAKVASEMNDSKRMGRVWQGWNAEIANAILALKDKIDE